MAVSYPGFVVQAISLFMARAPLDVLTLTLGGSALSSASFASAAGVSGTLARIPAIAPALSFGVNRKLDLVAVSFDRIY